MQKYLYTIRLNILLALVWLFSSIHLHAQEGREELTKKYVQELRYFDAIQLLKNSPENTSNKEILLAFCLSEIGEYEESIELCKKNIAKTDLNWIEKEDFFMIYAVCLQKTERCDKALELLKNIQGENKKRAEKIIHQCRLYENIQFDREIKLKILSNNINSDQHEYIPRIADEGNIIGWTYSEYLASKKIYAQSIKISTLNQPTGPQSINTRSIMNDFSPQLQHISSDARTLYYSSLNTNNGKIIDKRSKIINNLLANANTIQFKGLEDYPMCGYSINEKGNLIYFSSISNKNNRYDIYSSMILSDSTWSKPVRLDLSINTDDDEIYPFLHPNEQILYFSSNRKESVGGYDIYKSSLENGQWSKAQRLNIPINSISDDIGYCISPNSKTAYFSSNRLDIFKGYNIYSVDLPNENIPLTLIKGKVIAKDGGGIPNGVKIKVYDKEMGNELKYIYNPNPQNGKYLMIFPPGKNYNMVIEADGYLSYSFNIFVPQQKYYYQLQQTIYLHPENKSNDKGIQVQNLFEDNIQERDKDESVREEKLLQIIEKIIIDSDTHTLHNLDQYLALTSDKEAKYYASLIEIVNKVIESGDFNMLKELESITKPIQKNEPDIRIFFESNSSELNLEHKIQLKEFCKKLSNSDKIEITGHSDNLGSALSKYIISMLRAKTIAEYLENNCAISNLNIMVKSQGDAYPLGDNNTKEGSILNRRVEIRILK